ncbi:SAM-dependent methyltransferase [Chroococcidiopsis sp. CCALA 051]|uniref:FkbM family methyltransferase n=1 Tax=Chroococcidiopsis sp. CCALA 051 TaxID=869949 RepID=UPI000D0DFDA2|nr:FkbM family methyltransferase [Chroococcidiopsis sp. CCALA 051]PSM50621.1 SAM-dependent methyltransferase [Chroococcidiopsis sp. CCALA 051]
MGVKRILKNILPIKILSLLQKLKKQLNNNYVNKSYSQEGEDLILNKIFECKQNGFYVDVGAHHPKRFSNTYLFYQKGWNGINIDAMPGSMNLFKKYRPRDINIEAAIAKEKTEMSFFMFDEPALNTFDRNLAAERIAHGWKLLKEQSAIATPLKEILNSNLVSQQKIDFMSIDVEGLDLEVLYSNDWQAFKPEYILIECLNLSITKLSTNETYQFLIQQGYELFAKTCRTLIFKTSGL